MAFKIFLFLALLYVAQVNSQLTVLPDVDDFASRFMARIHHEDRIRGSLLSNGFFFNARTIVTTGSAVFGLTMAQLRVEFGNTNLIGLQSARPETVIFHPDFNANNLLENNLAIVRLSAADSNRTGPNVMTYREIGRLIRGNHFCSKLGYGELLSDQWQGREPMRMIPSIVESNSTMCNFLFRGDFTCSFGRAGEFGFCGGFVGSPIICDGERVSGMVVVDNFCGLRPVSYIMDLERHAEWIHRQSGAEKVLASIFMIFVVFLTSKIL
ncbi:unnamed protein product [Chironomus riparius]|uniref:Peptidase S1 domain-containing protein n=1 Tax=Chironomus riparius TaxID=315576 RepID=A0A9N9WY40_9DIPT|nr:unnamed protein product [Chironomus riparius]